MRGAFVDQGGLFSYIAPEARVPANHPLRKIRELVRDVLGELNRSLSSSPVQERPSEMSRLSGSVRMARRGSTTGLTAKLRPVETARAASRSSSWETMVGRRRFTISASMSTTTASGPVVSLVFANASALATHSSRARHI